MKIASWNVNSVRSRLERLLAWLERARPDVVCLQELKCRDADFPREELRAAGYHAETHGQKTYNGVAILAREPLADVRRGLGGGVDDPQARAISTRVSGLTVMSLYVPNGSTPDSEKYAYKLSWLARLRQVLLETRAAEQPTVLCGDFNLAADERDVHDREAWEGTVLFNPELRAVFTELLALGFVDSFRKLHPEARDFSWWDYRRLAFPRNRGLRIDYALCSRSLEGRLEEAFIDRDERKGNKPSDHVPVGVVLRRDAGSRKAQKLA